MTDNKTKNVNARGRGPVVHLNRIQKAKMIEAIISDYTGHQLEGLTILDIGCGNGDISDYFQRHNDQYGVDVIDQRKVENHSFHFTRVDSELIPFDDGFFDIVISHHVIEHVDNQGLHLDEIHRALKPGGVAYLATPNKSSPIMEGHVGNNQVLRFRDMQTLFERHYFAVESYSCRLLKQPDKFFGEVKYARFLPMPLLKLLQRFFPSHVFMLRNLN